MKTLIYCTKAKPRLSVVHDDENGKTYYYLDSNWGKPLNGRVVAQFDFDRWEMMLYGDLYNTQYYFAEKAFLNVITITENLLNKACLTQSEIVAYGNGKDLYAWHIDNLQVFDEVVELGELVSYNKYQDYLKAPLISIDKNDKCFRVTKAPQSYQYVYYKGEKCLLLSVKSEWVYKILNGEKTVEIRKNVPKEVR